MQCDCNQALNNAVFLFYIHVEISIASIKKSFIFLFNLLNIYYDCLSTNFIFLNNTI